MRPWLALFLTLSAGAHAEDIAARFRRFVQQNPPTVTWLDDMNSPTPSLSVSYGGPGLIRFTRDGGDHQTYEPKVMEFQRIPIERQLRVRSTSCASLPRTLSCRIRTIYPTLSVGIFPVGQAVPKRTTDLNSNSLSTQFIRSNLPELLPSPIEMICNDWAWAKNETSGLVEVIELAEIRDERAKDVEISQRGQNALDGDFTCPGLPGVACVLSSNVNDSADVTLLFAESLSMELNKTHACTVEFESITPPNPDNIFDLVRVSAQRRSVNPNAYATFQPRFTGQMLERLADDHIRMAFTGRRAMFDAVNRATEILTFGWLKFFGAIQAGSIGGSRGIKSFQAHDRIEEGDR